MNVTDILNAVKSAKGTNEKKRILSEHADNNLLKNALSHGLDPFTPFNVVKIPKVKLRLEFPLDEKTAWEAYFVILNECSQRLISGNTAIDRIYTHFCAVKAVDEVWMRKILKKHLAVGASIKTVNKVFPGLIQTFDVALAQKFDMKRIETLEGVFVEPKLDGIRCFSIVKDSTVQMFARSGKLITNFEKTIAPELLKMGDGCYDGELMGEDFISLMRQAYRKEDVNVSGTYLALFDFVPLSEWESRKSYLTCEDRFEVLLDKLADNDIDLRILTPVERANVECNYLVIKGFHDYYVTQGYEGAMIKQPDAPYKFGRGYEVMKLKAFHDVDLPVQALLEGTGKHAGKLGSVVVNYQGVEVQVGSGFSDELRERIWASPDRFIDRVIEVRYQEVTPDGSLRFPTFVCFRNDRST